MADLPTIVEDFGSVPCGIKAVKTFKFENKTNNTQELGVHYGSLKSELFNRRILLSDRVEIRPTEVVLQPKETVTFKINYYSHVEDITDNFSYVILDGQTPVTHFYARAKSVGPSLHPRVFNIKFFRFRDVNQTVKQIQITNTSKSDAKFQFDLDEDCQNLKISQDRGVIPAGQKFSLKFYFNSAEPGVYYRRVYCLVLFHRPLVFNIIAVYKPKLKLEPKNIKLEYPDELDFQNSYEAYMQEEEADKFPEEKIEPLQKCLEGLDLTEELDTASNTEGSDYEKSSWTLIPETPDDIKETKLLGGEVFLTNLSINMENSPEVVNATSLLNYCHCQCFYFEWDHDPKDHFRISPCRGILKPVSKTNFDIYFKPSCLDSLFHVALDLKIFRCKEEAEAPMPDTFDLPLTMTLRIIGHSFPDKSCGWIPQCKITPKVLHLRACVANEKIFGTFIMERDGHLPVTYNIMPTKNQCFSAHPTLGFLSRSFQLFVVQFNSGSSEPGIYEEDLKIRLNNSDANLETIRVMTTVEIPLLVFGRDNSITFRPVFPGSRVSTTLQINNPTHLDLMYEFKISDDMAWIEIVNPTGSIESKGKGELEIIFKPEAPCSYMEKIPCYVSSVHRPDLFETVNLQVVGSSQIGYLVATPSNFNLGECPYRQPKTVEAHLFNFSDNFLYFRLTVVINSFPAGDLKDVSINPDRGMVAAKGSLRIEITLKPHNTGFFEYGIECQNFQNDSDDAKPCEAPKKIISLKYEGVFPCIQIIDLCIYNPTPLFSSHMLWNMLCIDQVNEALRSLKTRHTLTVKIPEAVSFVSSINLGFLIECSRYGKLKWNTNLKIQCPCYEASIKSVVDECLHTKAVFIIPSKNVSYPLERSILMLEINFDSTNDSLLVLTFNLPYKKEVILRMPVVSLPLKPPTFVSCYLTPIFRLRPVFIGDPNPPLQLFWLYNNSNYPASYLVDMETLSVKSEENVFDCINPEGTIQPLTSYPLGFIFRPTEIITYSMDVELLPRRGSATIIKISGEGILQSEPLKQIGIARTAPSETIIQKDDLECCENFVDIPFIGMHSRVVRLFFIRNNSQTEKWSFKWNSEKFEDIFSVTIEPETGTVDPGKTARMMLSFQSYSHPTFVSFSLPCEILNHSQLKAYKESVRMQEILKERDDQCFVITEKGLSHPATDIPKLDRPSPSYIFITVNANIVSNLHLEMILSQKLQFIPKSEKRIQKTSNSTLKPPVVESVRVVLEKIFWDILCRRSFAQKIKDCEKSQNFVYKQIMPQSQKKKEEFIKQLNSLPSQHCVQCILETEIEHLLNKNFILGKNEKKMKEESITL